MVMRLPPTPPVAVLCAALSTPALAAGPVSLSLPTSQLEVGQVGRFTITVQGGQARGLPEVTVPRGLDATFVGQRQQVTATHGQMRTVVQYEYQLAALEPGTYTLGPARVTLATANAEQTLSSETITVTVAEGDPDDLGSGGDFEVTTTLSPDEAWVGQVVMYRYGIRSRRQILNGNWYAHPSEGLLVPRDGQAERKAYTLEDARGTVWIDDTWQPFKVTRQGTLSYEAPLLEVDVATGRRSRGIFGRMFADTEHRVLRGDAITLTARALPEPPPDFDGLVGDFELRDRFDSRDLRVGASAAWTVDLIGSGSVEGFSLPPVDTLDGAQIYDGAVQARAVVRDGEYRAFATFERSVVPTRKGTLELPAVEVVTFSPSRGRYVTLSTEPRRLAVQAGEDGTVELTTFTPPPARDETGEPLEDPDAIRPIRRAGPGVRLPLERWLAAPLLALALLPLGGLLLLLLDVLQAMRDARAEAERTRPATPLERLDHLPAGPIGARLAGLDEVLRLALCQATDTPMAELDPRAAAPHLPPPLDRQVLELVAELDRVRFAGAAPRDDLESRLVDAVRTLEALPPGEAP